MSDSAALVEAMKRSLRAHGLGYRDVAAALGMSEASIKRMFSRRQFTLDRVQAICDLLGVRLADLLRPGTDGGRLLTRLGEAEERELVSDTRLLLAAVCTRNHWRFEDIVRHYDVSEPECVRLLARLDRLGIIELLPRNRIKLRLAPDFGWIPGGPIERYFATRVAPAFLQDDFDGDDELRLFLVGSLSRGARDALVRRLRLVAREFAQLQDEDAALPLAERAGVGLMLGLRALEFAPFEALRRAPGVTPTENAP